MVGCSVCEVRFVRIISKKENYEEITTQTTFVFGLLLKKYYKFIR